MFYFQSSVSGTNWFLGVYCKIALGAGFPSIALLGKCSAFLGPKLNLQLGQRSLGLEVSSMSGVLLPKIFLLLQGKVQILAEKLHDYLGKVSFISNGPL